LDLASWLADARLKDSALADMADHLLKAWKMVEWR
jgi:hypothetical protein